MRNSGRGRDIGASIRDIDIGWKNKVIGGNRAIGGDRAIDGDISRKIRGWNNDSCGRGSYGRLTSLQKNKIQKKLERTVKYNVRVSTFTTNGQLYLRVRYENS